MKSRIYGLVALLLLVGGVVGLNRYYASKLERETAQAEDLKNQPAPEVKKLIKPEKTELLYGRELLSALQRGGYVIFIRHFQTDHSKWEVDPMAERHLELTSEDFLGSCDNQRPLTDVGRLRAKTVGKIMKKYGIPVAKIYSSPYCRTMEGVRLMFGREADESPKGLIYRAGGFTAEMMADFVRPLLGQVPEGPGNVVIMSHRPQMDDLGTIAEGQMYVFEPLGESKFNFVAKIYDYEWMESLKDPNLLGLTSITRLPEGFVDRIEANLGL